MKPCAVLRAHLPISKLGAAIGESSVVMVKIPSNLRSGLGAAMEAEIRARALDKDISGFQLLVERRPFYT